MRLAMMSSACFWPMTRWFSVSASLSTDSISFFTIRPTGMPVQSWTTLATACSSTVGRISGASPCSSASFFCSGASSARSALRSASLRPGSAVGAAAGAPAPSAMRRPPALDASRRRLRRRACAAAASTAGAGARSLARISRMRSTTPFSSSWRFCSIASRVSSSSIDAERAPAPLADVDADRLLAADDLALGPQRLEAALAVLELGRRRVLADGDARAGGVEQAHRLVGQLARRDVAMRQAHRRRRSPRRAGRRGGASRASRRRRAASAPPSPRSARRPARPGSAASAPGPSRCASCTRPRSSRAIVRSLPRASAGLSRLAASPVPAAPPAPISVCASSMNRMIGFGDACTSSITERSRFSNSPFMLAPACSRPMSST